MRTCKGLQLEGTPVEARKFASSQKADQVTIETIRDGCSSARMSQQLFFPPSSQCSGDLQPLMGFPDFYLGFSSPASVCASRIPSCCFWESAWWLEAEGHGRRPRACLCPAAWRPREAWAQRVSMSSGWNPGAVLYRVCDL